MTAFVCQHGNPVRPGEAFTLDQCRVCWLRAPRSAPEPPPAPAGVGIVIGCYGQPQLARLNVTMIRETCGNVPVLIADDGSNRDSEFERIEGAEFWPSDTRRGHYAGDLSVLWKGLQWAHTRGIRRLVKLSQRFVWYTRGWLDDALAPWGESATLMQRCLDNGNVPGRPGTDLYIRSECMGLDVPQWLPHYRLFDRGRLDNPTELYIWDLVVRHFGGIFAEWTTLTVDRYANTPGALWHGSHAEGPFRELAARHGIDLGSEFHVAGHNMKPNWVRG